MGLCDTVLLLDELPAAACPHGHLVRSFRTRDLPGPSMLTYLVSANRLYRAWPRHGLAEEGDPVAWRLDGTEAVHELRYELTEVVPVRSIRVYGRCEQCEPIDEHTPHVDLRLTFRYGQPVQVERTGKTEATSAPGRPAWPRAPSPWR